MQDSKLLAVTDSDFALTNFVQTLKLLSQLTVTVLLILINIYEIHCCILCLDSIYYFVLFLCLSIQCIQFLYNKVYLRYVTGGVVCA